MRGDRLGKVVSHHIVNAIVGANAAKLPAETHYKQRAQTAQFESWEKELAPILQKMFTALPKSKDVDEPLKTILATFENPKHQVELLAILVPLAVGFVMSAATKIAAPMTQSLSNTMNDKFADVPIPPELAAEMVAKGRATMEFGGEEALHGGILPNRFEYMVDNATAPLSMSEAFMANRLGLLTTGDLEIQLQRMGLDDGTIQIALGLRQLPPSVADIIQAAVQSQVDMATAQKVATQQGLDPAYFQILYNTWGNPIAPMEALELYNRGQMSEAEVEQALRESRLKNKYVPTTMLLARKLIALFELRTILTAGGMTDEQATEQLLMQGYDAADAAAVVKSAHSVKTATVREATKSELITAYVEGYLPKTEVSELLANLGYDQATIALELGLADYKKQYSIMQRAASKVGAQFIARKITRQQASSALDALQMPSAARDQLLAAWDVEITITAKVLTLAEVGAMAKDQIIYAPEFVSRLQAMGYSDSDIVLLGEYYLVQDAPTGAT